MATKLTATAIAQVDGSKKEGIHLLFNPPTQAGYSVYGFDIQRRVAQDEREIDCRDIPASELDSLHREFRRTLFFGD